MSAEATERNEKIAAASAEATAPNDRYAAFISYAHRYAPWVRAL